MLRRIRKQSGKSVWSVLHSEWQHWLFIGYTAVFLQEEYPQRDLPSTHSDNL